MGFGGVIDPGYEVFEEEQPKITITHLFSTCFGKENLKPIDVICQG